MTPSQTHAGFVVTHMELKIHIHVQSEMALAVCVLSIHWMRSEGVASQTAWVCRLIQLCLLCNLRLVLLLIPSSGKWACRCYLHGCHKDRLIYLYENIS